MVFSSPLFLFAFFPACLICYFLINKLHSVRLNNLCLFIFSVFFYAYGSLSFLPILLSSIVVNFILSNIFARVKNKTVKGFFFLLSIVINVSLLFVYKYLNLFTGFIFGTENATNIKLPIGISFYTFQVLSYLCDVQRKDVKPCSNILDFALFTLLFPQLIAGPIVRYSSIEAELKNRGVTFDSFSAGLKRFMIGFAKKILFANSLGQVADLAFNYLGYYKLGPQLSILVLVCYSMQIYLDFWAYSDMAIGIGKMFGFSFPENFNTPFLSRSISEFWSRWHITLSTFFRDYIYIPLGGNRKGLFRTCINLIIVFALSGFWHGASFNFLFWGLYNAFFLVIERIVSTKFKIKLPDTLGIIYVFVVWNIGMILFRLNSINEVKLYLDGLFSAPLFNSNTRFIINTIFTPTFMASFIISVLYLTPFFDKIESVLKRSKNGIIIVDTVIIVLFIYSVIEMLTSGFNPFIYFRF